jgi:hypothetical protein
VRSDGEDLDEGGQDRLPAALLNVLIASIGVYSALFAIGYGLYGNRMLCLVLSLLFLVSAGVTGLLWRGRGG